MLGRGAFSQQRGHPSVAATRIEYPTFAVKITLQVGVAREPVARENPAVDFVAFVDGLVKRQLLVFLPFILEAALGIVWHWSLFMTGATKGWSQHRAQAIVKPDRRGDQQLAHLRYVTDDVLWRRVPVHRKDRFAPNCLANEHADLAQVEHFRPADVDGMTAGQLECTLCRCNGICNMCRIDVHTVLALQQNGLSGADTLDQPRYQHCLALRRPVNEKEAQNNDAEESGVVLRQDLRAEFGREVKAQIAPRRYLDFLRHLEVTAPIHTSGRSENEV